MTPPQNTADSSFTNSLGTSPKQAMYVCFRGSRWVHTSRPTLAASALSGRERFTREFAYLCKKTVGTCLEQSLMFTTTQLLDTNRGPTRCDPRPHSDSLLRKIIRPTLKCYEYQYFTQNCSTPSKVYIYSPGQGIQRGIFQLN